MSMLFIAWLLVGAVLPLVALLASVCRKLNQTREALKHEREKVRTLTESEWENTVGGS